MKTVPLSLTAFLFASVGVSHAMVTFDWALVGNPGNAPDTEIMNDGTTGYGSVDYVYRISKHEVTNAQYAEFLNAVDPTGANTLDLYNINMPSGWGGIENTGTEQGAHYLAKAGRENNPVNYVTWLDAARFVNWLHNGQSNGSTETGVYTIDNGLTESRSSDATFFLPSEDEWYKAAYHDASAGVNGIYFDFADGTDSGPFSNQPEDDPTAANYYNYNNRINGFNDGYAVIGSPQQPTTENPLTNVGAYSENVSAYGTFDQNGNVWEWNETLTNPFFRGTRGGGWTSIYNTLRAAKRDMVDPFFDSYNYGFRVAAAIPEPSTASLGLLLAIVILCYRKLFFI